MKRAGKEGKNRDRKLCVFAKPPEPGKVKTRLFPALKPSDAAWLYLAFLNDITQELLDGPFRLCFAWAAAPDEQLPTHGGVECVALVGEGLGERLYNAFATGLAEAPAMVIVGSDQPELEKGRVVEAFERLEQGSEVVLGPSGDGGYYLIGLRREALDPGLFEDIPWSTGSVLAETLERCARAGRTPALLPVGYDIDEPADLDALALRLKQSSKDKCRFTRVLFEEWGRL
jgi:rSAM/selenodomain-associated transferase 1